MELQTPYECQEGKHSCHSFDSSSESGHENSPNNINRNKNSSTSIDSLMVNISQDNIPSSSLCTDNDDSKIQIDSKKSLEAKDAEIERLRRKVVELEEELIQKNKGSLSPINIQFPHTFSDCRRMAFNWGLENLSTDTENTNAKMTAESSLNIENKSKELAPPKQQFKASYTSVKRVSPSTQITRPHIDLSSYTHIDGEKFQQACVIISVHIVFSLASYIMDKTIIDTAPSSIIFLFGSAIFFMMYFLIDMILKKISKTYLLVSDDKKFYVLANLIKSSALFSYTPMALKVLYETLYIDNWQTTRIQNLGTLYTIPDFVSLILVRRMATTTIVHHIAVCIFNVFNVMNDYKQENICRLVVIYAIFSTFAYLVNLLLASRFLGIPKGVSRYFFLVALLVYVSCCAINWLWQLSYSYRLFTHFFHWSIIVYMSMLGMVVYDDIVLIKWLVLNLNPAYKNQQQEKKKKKILKQEDKKKDNENVAISKEPQEHNGSDIHLKKNN